MVLVLTVYPSRHVDIVTDAYHPACHRRSLANDYTDVFGNVCTRLVALGRA